jgi:endo-beta-N-acetylglucosaminidase D
VSGVGVTWDILYNFVFILQNMWEETLKFLSQVGKNKADRRQNMFINFCWSKEMKEMYVGNTDAISSALNAFVGLQ